MTQVVLAEKPAQARDIAKLLGIKATQDGFIECHNDVIVTPLRGHMVAGLYPNEYSDEWGKRWNWGCLPMVPTVWKNKLTTDKSRNAQMKVVGKLLKSAAEVIIATDAAREGELIARNVLEHFQYNGKIRRLWVSALTDKALKAGFEKLRTNAEMKPLHEAGLARNHADWLYGMNLSRGVTLAADTTETFSYGRVQTPTLYLVVQREWDIRAFKQAKYFELVLKVKTAGGHDLTLKHAPAADARITQKAEAERRMALAAGQTAPLKVTATKEKDAPELPFNLPALQKAAGTSLGLGASEVLAFLQSLYDKKIISYPRTDCRYLETGLQADVPATLASLAALFPEGVAIVKANGPLFRKNVFDDSKLTDHHGIIPTGQMMELSGMELRLFKIIAARYLQVLAPDARYELTKVSMDIKGVDFVTSGRVYAGKSFRDIKAN